jgi:hypothetical protein
MKKIYEESEKTSKKDEALIKEHLESFGLIVKKIDSKKNKNKAPDFGVEDKNGFYFYCEVKSVISDDKEVILHNTRFNKLERKIIDAYKKFLMINKNHFAPNVLYFLSNDLRINYRSLKEYLQGYINIFTDKIDIRKHRDGKAYDAVRNIDLFIWYTDNDNVQYFFNRIEDRFAARLQNIFEIDNFKRVIHL